jgi:serine/threonine protein kinase
VRRASYREPVDDGFVIAGKYHVVQLIAQGGMGAVYDAVNAKTGRRVALKLICERAVASGPAALLRFEREAKAAGGIESQHVVQVLDAGEDEASGMPFIAMEYLDGEDLRRVIARGPLAATHAIAIAKQVCVGLAKAHEAGIIHRDLKPANLFLAATDDHKRLVKLLDFGIAKLVHDAADGHELTRTGDLVGSPPYMSPEQLASPHSVDHRTDLWSLGVVLYEMLSGVTPTAHLSTVGARLYAICHVPAAPLLERIPGIRADVAALVHRALAIDPAVRFASAAEMLHALRALEPEELSLRDAELGLHRSSGPAGPARIAKRAPRRWSSSTRVRWIAVSVALLASIGVYVGRNGARARSDAVPVSTVVAAAPPVALAASSEAATGFPAPASEFKGNAARPRSSGALPRLSGAGARTFTEHGRAKSVEVDGGASAVARPTPSRSTGREEL